MTFASEPQAPLPVAPLKDIVFWVEPAASLRALGRRKTPVLPEGYGEAIQGK
jgi:hypothetical protein